MITVVPDVQLISQRCCDVLPEQMMMQIGTVPCALLSHFIVGHLRSLDTVFGYHQGEGNTLENLVYLVSCFSRHAKGQLACCRVEAGNNINRGESRIPVGLIYELLDDTYHDVRYDSSIVVYVECYAGFPREIKAVDGERRISIRIDVVQIERLIHSV